MKGLRKHLMLFYTFLKLGCFTFGGGWSIVAQIQKIYVEKEKSMTQEELLDLTSVARSLPGTMICNMALLFGYRTAGIIGGTLCVLGMVIPPLLIMAVVALFYSAFKDNQWVFAAMSGVRAAVVPIIISASLGMIKGAFKFPPCIAVMAGTFLAYLLFEVNAIYLVLIGGVCGIIISEIYERKAGGKAK